MALRRCNDCGGPVSSNAQICPNCGAPANSENIGCACLFTMIFLIVGTLIVMLLIYIGGRH
jgi:hypothetical protein